MVDVAGVRGLGEPGVDWGMRSVQPCEDPKRRLDLLVPLLHELVAWDLVQRADDGGFVLRQDVQERLAALTADRPLRSAEVFVGRKCQVCGLVGSPAWSSGCARARPVQPASMLDDSPVVVETGRSKGQRGFFHWHRTAS